MLIFETLLTEIIFNTFTAKRVAMYVPNLYVIFPLNYNCIKMRNNSKSHWAPKKSTFPQAQITTALLKCQRHTELYNQQESSDLNLRHARCRGNVVMYINITRVERFKRLFKNCITLSILINKKGKHLKLCLKGKYLQSSIANKIVMNSKS